MYLFRIFAKQTLTFNRTKCIPSARTFLSQAYYCNEVWQHRLQDPILAKVNPEQFFVDLDQRHLKTGRISAIDVDIFANAVKEATFVDELLDLTHKLRLSAETGNSLNSTSHAIVRFLNDNEKDEILLKVLDDRLNYGVFLDYYLANLLMNDYYKKNQFANGVRVAAQLMLQEESENPLSVSLGLLNCYNYLLKPEGWPEEVKPEEPEEEVKIRVKFLRNPYNDDHFDLRDPNKIVGKTLAFFTQNPQNDLQKSLHFLGLVLYGKIEKATNFLKTVNKINADIIKLLPENEEIKKAISTVPQCSENVQNLLETSVKDAERKTAEKDVAAQCEMYRKWMEERRSALQVQNKRLSTEQRMSDIEDLKQNLKERETKLWFFEKEEEIELNILAKKKFYPKRWMGAKKQPKKDQETYIPPEFK